jgi:hypothetical protein
MALSNQELGWLKENMGKELQNIAPMPGAYDMCLSDRCAIEKDGYLFATEKGQRLMAYFNQR